MIRPLRHLRGWAFSLTALAACGEALPGDSSQSEPPLLEEPADGQSEMIQQGISLTYRETTGNANMDMMLDMNDARLAQRRLLRLAQNYQVSVLALARPNDYEVGIDDVMLIAQKVNSLRSDLRGPYPLVIGSPYESPSQIPCGGSGSVGFNLFSISADVNNMNNWPVYEGVCSSGYGDFPGIDSTSSTPVSSSLGWNTVGGTFQDYCTAPPWSTYPSCLYFFIRNSEGVVIGNPYLNTTIQPVVY